MKTILLGVTGSIAAYKGADVARRLTKEGFSVHVIMTKAAREFITPLTFQTLTGNRVYGEMFDGSEDPTVSHIALAKEADLVLIAPATANIIAKLAGGIADDMLTSTCLAAWRKPLVICPAMNTNMYENPATQHNMEVLARRGALFVEPQTALLACGDMGKGALADPSQIVAAVRDLLEK